jgi:hypothetical protein
LEVETKCASVLFQMVEKTNEKTIDINLKASKNLNLEESGRSYRSFDGTEYIDGNTISSKNYNTSHLLSGNF